MAVHGAFAAFNPQKEDWSEYSERLTFYFTANGITTGIKKRAIFLSCCGPATFRSLVLPKGLDEFTFDELVAKVKDHKEPQPSMIVSRFQFNTPDDNMLENQLQSTWQFCVRRQNIVISEIH